jgi:hypothetical protein
MAMTQAPDDFDGEAAVIKPIGLISSGVIRLPIYKINLPMPPLGAKCLAIIRKGVFIFEEGPGTLMGIMCTHAGSGVVLGIDGMPDERGFIESYSPDPDNPSQDLTRPGLEKYHAHPAIMGAFQLNGGFHHGLTMIFGAGHDSVPTVATVTWMPFVKRTKN